MLLLLLDLYIEHQASSIRRLLLEDEQLFIWSHERIQAAFKTLVADLQEAAAEDLQAQIEASA